MLVVVLADGRQGTLLYVAAVLRLPLGKDTRRGARGPTVCFQAEDRTLMHGCPWNLPVTARTVQGMARTLARLAAWPLVSGQSASEGSMSRVAEGHFRRKREGALDIEGKHVTIQGHPGC